MKLVHLIIFGSVALFIGLCGLVASDENENFGEEYASTSDSSYVLAEGTTITISNNNRNGDEKIIMHAVRDAKTGMESYRIPLPASWKVSGNKMSGPHDTKVIEFNGKGFTGKMEQLSSVDQVVDRVVIPYLRSQGAQILNTVPLPQIAKKDHEVMAQYWSFAPTRKTQQVKGVEIRDKDGTLGLVIIHFTRMESAYGTNSFYYAHGISASDSYYETAKKHLIYGLANLQPNPQAIAMFNQREQQKAGQRSMAFNNRMRNNEIAFQNRQATHRDMVNSVNRSSMETWRNTSGSSDRMQQMTVEGIHGTQTMQDPNTGNRYQVEHGYDHYYMNGDNQYIGTNDHFYNPEMDPNVDHMNWRKMENNRNW